MFDASLLALAACVLIFAAGCLAHWALARAGLKQDAADEYADRRKHKPRTVENVGAEVFERIYVSSHTPRWALYAAGAALAALAISPLALLLVPAGYDLIWRAAGAPDWAGRGGYVFMFSLFFAIVFCWAAVAGAFARLHHKSTPAPFHHQLARARGEPLPDETAYRPRPKWARRARPVTEADRELAESDTPKRPRPEWAKRVRPDPKPSREQN